MRRSTESLSRYRLARAVTTRRASPVRPEHAAVRRLASATLCSSCVWSSNAAHPMSTAAAARRETARAKPSFANPRVTAGLGAPQIPRSATPRTKCAMPRRCGVTQSRARMPRIVAATSHATRTGSACANHVCTIASAPDGASTTSVARPQASARCRSVPADPAAIAGGPMTACSRRRHRVRKRSRRCLAWRARA